MSSKEERAGVFRDTERWIRKDTALSVAVKASVQGTVFYPESEEIAAELAGEKGSTGTCPVTVTSHRSFEAAMLAHREDPEAKIAVLNFASATNPGGGVVNGSSAQEESLCRCSTLYPVLKTDRLWQQYYGRNRAQWNPLHTDDCIYTPGIVICKSDTDAPKRLGREDWVTVDVISCAAPNLREKPGNIHNPEYGSGVHITKGELYDLHVKRAKSIVSIAAANHVEILILGAFGCGAFANDPETVAMAMREAVRSSRQYFKRIEFAVYCGVRDTRNYDIFREIMEVQLK
ncbi:MAG: TIGR02452 family protein [Clostridia bacterium]|nr:TIGR02452 family protein [Clostridia bacterium]